MGKKFASALALVVVAWVHIALEHQAETLEKIFGQNYAQIAGAGIAIGIGIIALLFLEYLLEFLYDSSGYLRYWSHWFSRKPYFEGWWVDVGVDQSAGIPEVKNYSFIVIFHEAGELKIDGLTWETHRPDWQDHWVSIYSAAKETELYFEYTFTSRKPSSTPQGHETAKYRFMIDRNSFEGNYDGDKFTSFGQLKNLNKRCFGSHYRLPSLEEQEKLAQEYFKCYIKKHKFDPNTFRRRVLSQSKARREDAFVRFVKESNSKAAEVGLLNKALGLVPWSSSPASILDLGAGEGTMTIPALQALKFESGAGRYVAVDSNGILLEALSTQLQSECGRNEDKNTILMRRTIDDFVLNNRGRFDLVLACHCLYFVEDVSSILSAIFRRILKTGGRFVSMHTDIKNAEFIKQLAQQFNPSLQLDIINEIKKMAEGTGMECLCEKEADITLTFPHLDCQDWSRVSRNGEGDDVAKVIELISFIIDRGPEEFHDLDDWKKCVGEVRSHLGSNKDRIVFPIILHVFEKH